MNGWMDLLTVWRYSFWCFPSSNKRAKPVLPFVVYTMFAIFDLSDNNTGISFCTASLSCPILIYGLWICFHMNSSCQATCSIQSDYHCIQLPYEIHFGWLSFCNWPTISHTHAHTPKHYSAVAGDWIAQLCRWHIVWDNVTNCLSNLHVPNNMSLMFDVDCILFSCHSTAQRFSNF